VLTPDPALRRAQINDALKYWIVIPFGVIAGGFVLDRLTHAPKIPVHWPTVSLAAVLLVAGMFLIRAAINDLSILGHGTPNPNFAPRQLVTSGVYALCRHPMFLGYDLAALGVVLLCASPGMLLGAYPLFLLFQVRFLKNEERMLLRRFEKDFDEYRRRIPFLLPIRSWRRT
jgi:protein-S-isoprenylcysteine O-methyltransferase Ste14